MEKENLTAVGAYIFAGGFTLGVEKSFEILAHLEGSHYGVDTFKLNRPNIPVYEDPGTWPTNELNGRVNFIYCNPPCAPFSVVGASLLRGKDNWRTDSRVSCHHHCFGLLKSVNPDVLAIESVPAAYKRGKELWDDMTTDALQMGYSVTHLFEDAQWFGIPQKRPRYMFIAHKYELKMEKLNWAPPPTISETLSSVTDPGYHRPVKPEREELYKQVPPNMGVRTIWERLNPPETWVEGPNGVKGRPRFCEYRADKDGQIGAYIGDFVIHPTEGRFFGLEEAKAICGFPEDFKFSNPGQGFSELARGVMPPVGAYLARSVAHSIRYGGLVYNPTVRIVDMKCPRENEDDYITPLFAVTVPLDTAQVPAHQLN